MALSHSPTLFSSASGNVKVPSACCQLSTLSRRNSAVEDDQLALVLIYMSQRVVHFCAGVEQHAPLADDTRPSAVTTETVLQRAPCASRRFASLCSA